ncbi:2255_t:CDS:2 [Cetraspora pellucida]|uniref:2255_t:CDS:1 n=1 Tax=Cetraspora pellucida TaxID=1433469 RepID=A0ACA9MAN2_9GLOM|nr:2255_t:CDS:2 [Cetraspora pellucida]
MVEPVREPSEILLWQKSEVTYTWGGYSSWRKILSRTLRAEQQITRYVTNEEGVVLEDPSYELSGVNIESFSIPKGLGPYDGVDHPPIRQNTISGPAEVRDGRFGGCIAHNGCSQQTGSTQCCIVNGLRHIFSRCKALGTIRGVGFDDLVWKRTNETKVSSRGSHLEDNTMGETDSKT